MHAYCPIVLLSYCHNWNIGSLAALRFPLPGLSYHVCHHAQLLGCSQAEVPEGEHLGVGRSGERGVEAAVGSAVDVDEAPLIDVRVALLRYPPALPCVLHEGVVPLAVVRDHPSQVSAYGQPSPVACEQLEVDARLGVGGWWVGRCSALVSVLLGVFVLWKNNGQNACTLCVFFVYLHCQTDVPNDASQD